MEESGTMSTLFEEAVGSLVWGILHEQDRETWKAEHGQRLGRNHRSHLRLQKQSPRASPPGLV
jgi:hypothetical protein